MDSFIAQALSRRPKSTNLLARLRKFTLRHLNIINLQGSGEQLALVGSTSLERVTSHQLGTCRHFFYHSGDAQQLFDIDPNSLVQASILEYSIGAPIGWHRDIPQFGNAIGISLGARCRMRFRKYSRNRSKVDRDEILSIELEPRSIYFMSGAARESWQHSIPPVKELRYSVVMRTLRAKPKLIRDRDGE